MPNTRTSPDHCPTCGRQIGDWDDNGAEADDGRWCMNHAVEAKATIGGMRVMCINESPECSGAYAYRMPLSGTGKSFMRCDKHWSERLDQEDKLRERYPEHAPSDFDPSYAGESWGDDY